METNKKTGPTPAEIDKQNKMHAYIEKKRDEQGLPPSNLTKLIPDSVLAATIGDVRKSLGTCMWAMKKRYPADFKAYTKQLEQFTSWLTDHSHSNNVIFDELTRVSTEIREHPATKEASEVDADRKSKLEMFAAEHTIAVYGGKVCIRREKKHDWILPEQLAKFNANLDIPGADGKPQNIVSAFMEWDGAKRYGEVAFDPSIVGHYDDVFNLWQGWSVQPEPGDDDATWWEVLSAACGYNADYVDYVSKWFADIFQNPTRMPGTAIGISGRQGIGKSALVETIGMLLANINKVDDKKTITGAYGDFSMDELLADYNEHVANKLLVYLDEATWGGSHVEQQRMKKIITKQFENINPKFLGRIQLPCYRRVVFSSNNEWYYRPDKDDRRLLPLEYDTSEIHEKSYDFWKKFYTARSGGKMLANLLHNLLKIDLTDWEPQEAIKKLKIVTGQSMIDNSREPWEHWLYEIAEEGSITIEVDGEHGKIESPILIENQSVADKNFENAFMLWARKHRINGSAANWYGDKFKKERTKMLGEQIRRMSGKEKFKVRDVPSCEEMLKRLKSGQRWGQ